MAKGETRKKKEKELTPEEKLERALVPAEEQPYRVPENWCWVYLSDLAERISKGTTPKGGKDAYVPEGVNFLRVENINDDGTISHDNIAHITSEMHMGFLKRSILQKGDILVSIAGTLGKTGMVSEVDLPLNTNQAVSFIRLKNKCFNRRYIKASIDNPAIQERLQSKTKVTSIPNLTLEIVCDCTIPLAPLPEQRRIVDRLESMFARLDEAKEKAQAVVDGFELRKSAILHRAFSGGLTEQWRKAHNVEVDSWKTMCINDIGEVITGSTPSTKHPEYFNGNVPFIKPTELNQGRTVSISAETLTEEGKKVSRFIRAGATCVCCIGATISKCGMLSVGGVTNQQINSIVPYEFMDDVFVYYYCCSKKFKESLIDNSSATTLPIINKKKMLDLKVLVPLKEEQIIIAQMLDLLFEKEERARRLAKKVLGRIDIIKKAILARAFCGELGTNDPAEESAVELLKATL